MSGLEDRSRRWRVPARAGHGDAAGATACIRRARRPLSVAWRARRRCCRCCPRCSAACSGAFVRRHLLRDARPAGGLTGSEYGFIGEVLHDEAGESFLRMHGLSDISWSPESRALFERMRTGGFEFHNLDTFVRFGGENRPPVI